ncbi:MAG: hypothetical protein QOF08_3013 [Gaiellales bacterium]|nr:hypothetical protein [Gaiellales bacterium]
MRFGTAEDLTMDQELDDTQQIRIQAELDAEIARLLTRLRELLPDHPHDPGHRLLAALISMWPDLPARQERFEAAANLLTLGERDVWFLAANDPVEALVDAASRLLVALGDAVTAAGANFYFDSGEPFTPAGHADDAYVELGDAIGQWKDEVLVAHRQRAGSGRHLPR